MNATISTGSRAHRGRLRLSDAHPDVVASAEYDDAAVAGSERAGQIYVVFQPELGLSEPGVTIRFPHYAAAGHMVTHMAPGELLADVEAWYAAGP